MGAATTLGCPNLQRAVGRCREKHFASKHQIELGLRNYGKIGYDRRVYALGVLLGDPALPLERGPLQHEGGIRSNGSEVGLLMFIGNTLN